jgi:hypothetical protein
MGASSVSGGRSAAHSLQVARAPRSLANWSRIDFFRCDFLSALAAEFSCSFVVRSKQSTSGSNANE